MIRQGPTNPGSQSLSHRPYRWVAPALVTLAAPVLLYLILRAAVVSLQPALAYKLPPTAPRALLERSLEASILAQSSPSPQAIALARETAVRVPLAHEPFLVFANVARAKGDRAHSLMLLEEARDRRPMSRLAILQLATAYGEDKRYPEMIGELNVLIQRSGVHRSLLLAEFAKLISSAEGRAALAPVLATRPEWTEDFFQQVNKLEIAADSALDLLRRVRSASGGVDLAPERALYMDALVREGNVPRAREMWLRSNSAAGIPNNSPIVDPAFKGLKAGPPFGWKFASNEHGHAEISSNAREQPRLGIRYFGGGTLVLAEQLVALRPGRRTLTAVVKSETGVTSGHIFWELRCIGASRGLGEMPLDQASGAYQVFRSQFAIPTSDCSGQRLRLVAEPGDIAKTVSLTISRVSVE